MLVPTQFGCRYLVEIVAPEYKPSVGGVSVKLGWGLGGGGGILESFGEDTMPSTIIEALTHNIFLYTVRKVFSYRFGTKFYLMIFSLILAIHN